LDDLSIDEKIPERRILSLNDVTERQRPIVRSVEEIVGLLN